jgi:transposase
VEGHAYDWLDTQKKTPVARERDRPDVIEKRRSFLKRQRHLGPKRLVFLDESGFRLGAPPHYGWAPSGEKSRGKSVQGAWQTMTMLGAISLDGFRGFMTIDAATNSEIFAAFVRHQLVPNLRPGDIVVMDNLAAHKNEAALSALYEAGATALFLPPYSPELNPIEQAWAKMQEILRRMHTLTREAFDSAVATAMRAVSSEDIHAWTAHAGYELASR